MITITRIFDIIHYQLERFNQDDSMVTKQGGAWIKTSSKLFIDTANKTSRALLRLGVEKNDKIAVISSNNRTEWHVLDVGILQTGAQNVPIYPTISEEDYEYVLNHSETKYCFVSDTEILAKVIAIQSNVPTLKDIYTFDEVEGIKSFNSLLELGEDHSNQNEVEIRKQGVMSEDLATIIYTSGTEGSPKGVMLSHKNIISNVLASAKRVPLGLGAKALSFLPLCHVFERMIIYLYQYCGISVYFAESIDKINVNLGEVKPDIITVVPRFIEKIYDKIYARGNELTGIKKKIFLWAIALGEKYKPYKENGWWYEKKLSIAQRLIFDKWIGIFGGNLKMMISGSASLQPRLNRIFAAAGIPIMEGYGLTETSPVIAVNDQRNKGWKIGTVGKIIENVVVKIAGDGEILCNGPGVMMGYYKDPNKTSKVIREGYFFTGDIGELDEEGFLRITDRKKEIFKTSGGKYIAPQIVENQMKQSQLIEQIMIIGEDEKMPAALIQPNFERISEWAKKNNVDVGNSKADLVIHPKVRAYINEEITFYNKRLGKWEKIKKFELTPDVWTIESGHLTPTLKLKRQNIKELYKDLYNKIYGNSTTMLQENQLYQLF